MLEIRLDTFDNYCSSSILEFIVHNINNNNINNKHSNSKSQNDPGKPQPQQHDNHAKQPQRKRDMSQ